MVQKVNNINREIADFLSRKAGHVHFAGVCGVGMAGLAFLLKARGFNVSGCDLVSGQMAEWLKKRGIKVYSGHDAKHITKDVGWVIRSAAVPVDSPEIKRAMELGVPVFSRGSVLPEVIAGFKSVAVGGTHGKTTTTTFITRLLKSAGLQPSWCIGGESVELGGVAGFRGESVVDTISCRRRRNNVPTIQENLIVVEADESDGTLALYRPDIAVVTNIEFDHMEHFESVEAFEECFRKFINGARQRAVYCADDPRASAMCRSIEKCISYGLGKTAEIRGVEVAQHDDSSEFTVVSGGMKLGKIHLPVPGIHNVLNALAATAVGFELGLSFEQIQRGLGGVCLPRRRFELIAKKDGVTVISDYAHHPSEIRALVRTAGKLKHSRLLAVFQPHRYTRTLALGPDFPGAFDGVDELVLVPVYAASERPLKGGSIWDLYEHFIREKREVGGQRSEVGGQRSEVGGQRSEVGSQKSEIGLPKVSVATSLEQAWAYFKTQFRKGDLFLVVGAGDVEKIAVWAREEKIEVRGQRSEVRNQRSEVRNQKSVVRSWTAQLPNFGLGTRVRFNEPLGKKTTIGVGGAADVFVETGSVKDLVMLLERVDKKKIPFKMLGGGSNVVVSDLGVRGVTVRLSGGDFGGIRCEKGMVVAGAGFPISKLLGCLEERGLGGLEFLEGIPGTVGGAVRMNAGAWGDEIGRHISWIRCLNMDGAESTVRGKSVKFRYRECLNLRNRILIEVGFNVSNDGPDNIRKRRLDFRQRRNWMKGFRSAGSVFKNHDGKFAGKLIEQAGLKGMRIGGAVVSDKHANIIVTRDGASASDVMALISKVRDEVISKAGVRLDTEVEFLE